MSSVSIIMYHYVRDLPKTRFPGIKGLLTSDFVGQLDYFSKHYQFVTMQECMAATYDGLKLPKNAALLTFDDGYSDHFQNVFPQLLKRSIQGSFFPPAKAVMEADILDVNKVHFILAAGEVDAIKRDIDLLLKEHRSRFGLDSPEKYYAELAHANRFDGPDVIFVKRILQHALPLKAREVFTDFLFAKYVSTDKRAFSKELYMSVDQLKTMRESGMYIGSHGYQHLWLNKLPPQDQRIEVERSLMLLESVGTPATERAMCYPYGASDESLIGILKEFQFKLGFTTAVGIAKLSTESAYRLERLDTVDFPRAGAAAMNAWTEKTLA